MKQFRPISLCNVIYKVMAKTIANRLRRVIEKCIDVTQSTFVPGRLISDNVLLVYEMLLTLKQKRVGQKSNSKGFKGENFQLTRGLRQGDSLNPFMFLICGEGLSCLMRLAMREGMLRGVKASRSGLQLGHLPPLTWKSVWAAKGLLRSGMSWRIGRGTRISV
ncbi:hypothetical protein J1N35_005729 [Gossypium stocksii]|uniref:Reverse transcriptase domain-containing protein n=1 Tax=Gossypium stocksii TaxID=47602 RepID=A0A9D4AIV9_9ROSI|nr:hypothetical protein J1N35_005729 [Gossypium stocksii]